MRQTLHQAKCRESQANARKAMKNTARKTAKKQEATLSRLRKKTWGF
jgi:hypothetical protein